MRVSHLAALAALAVLGAAPAFANGPMSAGSTGATTSTTPPPDYTPAPFSWNAGGAYYGSAGGGNRGRMVRDYDDEKRRPKGSGYDYRPRLRDAHFLGSDVVRDRRYARDSDRETLRRYHNQLGW
jgi:hypothetical protein